MKNDKIITLETRIVIYNYISKNPGLHLRFISRELKIPKTTLDYHIRFLIKRGLIIKKQYQKYSRYYIANTIGSKEEEIFAILRQKHHVELF